MGQGKPIGDKTILIVEDEPLIRMDLVDFFEDSGWRVYEAENADDAIVLLEGHKEVRVVLTDVEMPGSMNGLRLAHYVRDRFPPTTLYVVSGRMKLTMDDLPEQTTFLPKPFNPYVLLRELDALQA
ncbi:MAG TPA: response regulator [Candidatus Sphingomonas excrementigallinarum]|nr:response regulator [Candidatus Sphingomonas excrementigallinarum]